MDAEDELNRETDYARRDGTRFWRWLLPLAGGVWLIVLAIFWVRGGGPTP